MARRVTIDGKVVNKATYDMLARAKARSGVNFRVIQGSYNAGGVTASAGTHDGGGAVDISVVGISWRNVQELVLCLREVGFAAWYRPDLPGKWDAHIHAIRLDDPEASSGARNQMVAYRNGRDGLAGNGPDNGPRLNPIPVWPIKRPWIYYHSIIREFKSKTPKSNGNIKRVQWVLNRRLDTNLKLDGVAGPQTRAVYKQWQKRIGREQTGVPTWFSLTRLVAGFFRTIV